MRAVQHLAIYCSSVRRKCADHKSRSAISAIFTLTPCSRRGPDAHFISAPRLPVQETWLPILCWLTAAVLGNRGRGRVPASRYSPTEPLSVFLVPTTVAGLTGAALAVLLCVAGAGAIQRGRQISGMPPEPSGGGGFPNITWVTPHPPAGPYVIQLTPASSTAATATASCAMPGLENSLSTPRRRRNRRDLQRRPRSPRGPRNFCSASRLFERFAARRRI